MPTKIISAFWVLCISLSLSANNNIGNAYFSQYPAVAVKDTSQNDLNLEIPAKEQLNEVIISGTKFEDKTGKTSLQINKLSEKKLATLNNQSTPDIIERANNTYLQKSQLGGGSPILRGLEANKILLSIDGIKLNNAIYRGGHLQNSLTVGYAFLESLEIITGPGSLIYGSDALGGVISFHTKNPNYERCSAQLNLMFAAPNRAWAVNFVGNNVVNKKWASLTGISINAYQKYSIGKWRPKAEYLWGFLPEYVQTNAPIDTIIQNQKPHQIASNYVAYKQFDFLQKLSYKIDTNRKITFNFQASTTTHIPRFDRLNDYTNGVLKYAQWAYGPQTRTLAAVHYISNKNTALAHQFKTTIAHQYIEESRIDRRVNQAIQTNQIDQVNVYSLSADAIKKTAFKDAEIQYGSEWILNTVKSTAFEKNVWNNELPTQATTPRYPDGNNLTQSIDLYALMRLYLSPKTALNFGARGSAYQLKIAYNNLPFPSIDLNKNSLNIGATYALGIHYQARENTKIKANISSGFRAPNIDDIGKIFDPAPLVLVIPNTQVKPEYLYNYDVLIQQKISTFANIEAGVYFTRAKNLINRAPTTIDEKNTIEYQNEIFDLYSNTNVGKANIWGYFAVLKLYDKLGYFQSNHNLNFTKGTDLSDQTPLGHIPPLYGKNEFIFRYKNWECSQWTFWNAAKKISAYSNSSEDKLDEALPLIGTPAWASINMQIAYTFKPQKKSFVAQTSLALSAENITDLNYRPFSSGINSAGRNFRLKLSANF